jgi:polyhydroxyalkanoate synthase
VRFIIAGSGHIAGVINPPSARKYQYWTNDAFGMTPDGKAGKPYPAKVEDWQAGAKETPGSWWPDWDAWLSKLSGPKVPARKPGDCKLKVLGDAPGTYVKVKAR